MSCRVEFQVTKELLERGIFPARAPGLLRVRAGGSSVGHLGIGSLGHLGIGLVVELARGGQREPRSPKRRFHNA